MVIHRYPSPLFRVHVAPSFLAAQSTYSPLTLMISVSPLSVFDSPPLGDLTTGDATGTIWDLCHLVRPENSYELYPTSQDMPMSLRLST
jgi:hypothetical protein